MRRVLPLLLCAAVAACAHKKPAPVANPHYVLEPPYQAGGVWFYPAESYAGVQTGIAAIEEPGHPALTADGEVFDDAALAAAHQTVQLPAIARVTNLENGRQITVRVNDRGPPAANRLIAVTGRAAALLAMTGPVRVRVEFLPAESHQVVDALGGRPQLAISTAPRGDIQASDLPPPGSAASAGPERTIGEGVPERPGTAAVPARMPEIVMQSYADPGTLEIQLSTFSSYAPANRQRALVADLSPRIDEERNGRNVSYTVRIGPIATIAEADAKLARIIRTGGAPDARIVVD
jgi:rare lipoprotein A